MHLVNDFDVVYCNTYVSSVSKYKNASNCPSASQYQHWKKANSDNVHHLVNSRTRRVTTQIL